MSPDFNVMLAHLRNSQMTIEIVDSVGIELYSEAIIFLSFDFCLYETCRNLSFKLPHLSLAHLLHNKCTPYARL